MADVSQAVQFVLRQEDARLNGAITTLPGDGGGPTRFGLASRWHPDLVDQGFYQTVEGEALIPHDEALAIAEKTYETEYASVLELEQIGDQDLGNHLLSFAVNEGPQEACALLQRSLNLCGANVEVDGVCGPCTLKAVNGADPAKLLAALRAAQEGFYRHLVAVRPELLPYLDGFLNRAQA